MGEFSVQYCVNKINIKFQLLFKQKSPSLYIGFTLILQIIVKLIVSEFLKLIIFSLQDV